MSLNLPAPIWRRIAASVYDALLKYEGDPPRIVPWLAERHEAWIVQAFDGLQAREVDQLHRLLGKVKRHQQRPAGDAA